MSEWPNSTVLDLAAGILGPRCVRGRPLGPLTTYRVGGPAAVFLDVERRADLQSIHDACVETGLPILVVGRGSNLLVADAGFPGIAMTLGRPYDSISFGERDADVVAGGATYLPVLARRCAAAGIGGLEWGVGIPGSVGGGVCMNAGGHGADMGSVLVKAQVYDLSTGQGQSLETTELGLSYRHSVLSAHQVVLEAFFEGSAADPAVSRARIAEIVRWRREHQPGGANAGSVFVNPDGDTAGRLVEAVGCKGYRIGTAQVSERHANFIQADSGGSADDIASLIEEICRRVTDQTGISLSLECRLAGYAHQSTLESRGK